MKVIVEVLELSFLPEKIPPVGLSSLLSLTPIKERKKKTNKKTRKSAGQEKDCFLHLKGRN